MSVTLSKEKMSQISLRKDKVISLAKERGIFGEKAQVVLAIDISGSMGHLYRNGTVQRTLERIVPLALQFDDNGSLDVALFHNQGFLAEDCTLANLEGYVDDEIVRKYQFGGTSYAPVIKLIADKASSKKGVAAKLGGMFSSLMGKKEETKALPTYVVFITDGDNDDHSATERLIRELSGQPIFWQFVGIGSERFGFLDKLDNLSGREVDNAAFFKANDIDRMTDDQLYSELLKEFPGWIPQMRKLGKIA